MPSIISIIGTQNSGKTTLVEKLVAELTARGRRVATMKHAAHGTTFDQPGKDSWRHIQAGSRATIISSPEQMVLVREAAPDAGPEELARYLGEEYDIILAEGFKQGKGLKIEVHRKEIGPPLSGIEGLLAIATDEPLERDTRQFALDDIKGMVDLIEDGFISDKEDRLSLYINNKKVLLKEFPRGIITNILLAIAGSLSGVEKLKSLVLFLRKKE